MPRAGPRAFLSSPNWHGNKYGKENTPVMSFDAPRVGPGIKRGHLGRTSCEASRSLFAKRGDAFFTIPHAGVEDGQGFHTMSFQWRGMRTVSIQHLASQGNGGRRSTCHERARKGACVGHQRLARMQRSNQTFGERLFGADNVRTITPFQRLLESDDSG